MIFIDASLPKTVADELKKVREDVIFKHDIFRPGTDDSIWLRKVGVEGWLGITHDQHIRTRPGERDAIMSHSVGCFILTYKQDLQKPEIVRMVFDYLPEMERLFNSTPRPFIYTVTKNGHFTEYAQRRLETPQLSSDNEREAPLQGQDARVEEGFYTVDEAALVAGRELGEPLPDLSEQSTSGEAKKGEKRRRSSREGVMVSFRAQSMERVYTFVMGLPRFRTNARAGFEGITSTDAPKLGPWGVYGEAIGNPKFYLGTNPKDSEFLQAADEFASAHEDLLRELAKR